jgi:hypothetical protein
MSGGLAIGLFLLCILLFLELVAPQKISEGFQGLIPVLSEKNSYFSQFVKKRGDVNPYKEQKGYVMDPRYFHDYTDVQRLGVNQDYCRMVMPLTGGDDSNQGAILTSSVVNSSSAPDSNESKMFFACALGGTDDMSTVEFKTATVQKGFRLGRDDYMRDIMKDGRSAYCRILKDTDKSFQPVCRRSLDTGFADRDEVDPMPPDDITRLLTFYDGCVLWLRLYDDMKDYIDNVQIYKNGGLAIDETPRPAFTRGLTFDGAQQFMRIGDDAELALGSVIKMRTVRAFSVWVYMEEFTNNAKFFDFGDGAGKNNVFLGILGKGDPELANGGSIRPLLCGAESTVPQGESGAQFVPEITPQLLMKTTAANVDEYTCIDQEVKAKVLMPSSLKKVKVTGNSTMATLHYEVWDQRQRKMSIKVNSAIPLKKWTHIAVTAISSDATRPDIGIFVNGSQVYVQPSGYLPQASSTSNNYLGKSNWVDNDSTYELRDELLSGSLFDFRMYNTPMSKNKIKNTIMWGRDMLGLQS